MGNLRDADGRRRWGEVGESGSWRGNREREGRLGFVDGEGRETGCWRWKRGELWRHYQPERRRQQRPVAAAAAAAGVGNLLDNAGEEQEEAAVSAAAQRRAAAAAAAEAAVGLLLQSSLSSHLRGVHSFLSSNDG